jgi:hypothetical protein
MQGKLHVNQSIVAFTKLVPIVSCRSTGNNGHLLSGFSNSIAEGVHGSKETMAFDSHGNSFFMKEYKDGNT